MQYCRAPHTNKIKLLRVRQQLLISWDREANNVFRNEQYLCPITRLPLIPDVPNAWKCTSESILRHSIDRLAEKGSNTLSSFSIKVVRVIISIREIEKFESKSNKENGIILIKFTHWRAVY